MINSPAIENSPGEIVYLGLGDPAPYAGVLLTPKRAARLAVLAEQCPERTAAEVTKAVGLVAADLALEQRLRALDAQAKTQEAAYLRQALQDALAAQKRAWWEAPELWFAAGVVAAVGVVAGAVAVLNATAGST